MLNEFDSQHLNCAFIYPSRCSIAAHQTKLNIIAAQVELRRLRHVQRLIHPIFLMTETQREKSR